LVDAQTIGVLVTAASVTVAAVYYIMTLRVQQTNMKANLETRQAQMLMNLYERWNEPRFQNTWFETTYWEYSDYDDFMKKYYRTSNPEAYGKFMLIATFFEGIGVFVKRSLIDAALVDDMMSVYIIGFWGTFGPFIIEFRKRRIQPTYFEHVEYLYGVVHEIWKQQHPGAPETLVGSWLRSADSVDAKLGDV
jgi:hypothetical protein